MADAITVKLDDNFGANDGTADSVADPAQDSPEALKAKADAYDARQAGETTEEKPAEGVIPAMPDTGLEKYYNKETGVYHWENHAKELAYNLNRSKAEKIEPPKKVEIKTPDPKAKPEETAALMQDNFDAMAQEFAANGEISEENRGKLNTIGITDTLIDTYLQGIQSTNELVTSKSRDLVGGQDQLDAILKWAGSNLPKSEAAAINTQLSDPQMWETALLGLRARYNNKIGTSGEPELIDGNASGGQVVQAYEDAAQSRVDMKNPLYKTSQKFRNEVLAKMRAAMANGVNFG